MSLSPNEKYPGATEADPNYKDSKFKDNNPSTTNNGSPLKALDRNEQLALQEAMMNAAGFDYNGVVDTPQNSQMFNAYKAALSNGANLLSNHNFIIASPDDSQPAPSATPTSYPPGYEIFSGVFANETTGILNLTYIDGRVSFSGGDFYMAVPNTGALENTTEFVASVADFDGKPRTRGVSFALVGDEYRVTVGVDALEDAGAVLTPLGSVKLEQGSVATGHGAGSLSAVNLSDYTDIVYKASGGKSAVENMFSQTPLSAAIGDILSTGSTSWVKNNNDLPIDENNFRALNGVTFFDFGAKLDGIADDTVAVQKAFSAARNYVLCGFGGRMRITSPVKIYDNTDYRGSNNTVFIHDYAQADETAANSMFSNEHCDDNSNLNTNIYLDGMTFETGPNAGRGSFLAVNRVEGFRLTKVKGDKQTGGFSVWVSAKNFFIDEVELFSQYAGITNSDGIHFEYIENGVIGNLNIASEDDCLGFAYFPLDGIYDNPAGRDKPSKNIVVSGAVLSSTSNGIRLGNTTLLGLAKDNLYHPDARFENVTFDNITFDKIGSDGFCIEMYEVRQNSAAPNNQIRFSNLTLTDNTSINQMIRVRGNPYTAGLATYVGNESIRNYGTVSFSGLRGNNGSFSPTLDISGVSKLTLVDVDVERTAVTDNELITQLTDFIYINDSKIRSDAQDALANTAFFRDFQKVVINDTLLQGTGQEVAGVRVWQENLGDTGILRINRSEIIGQVGGVHAVSPVVLGELSIDAVMDITGTDRNSNLDAVKNDRKELSNLHANASVFTNNECRKHGGSVNVVFDINVSATINSGEVIASLPINMAPANASGARSLAIDTASPPGLYPFEFSGSGDLIARRGIPSGTYFYTFTYSTNP